MEWTPIILKLAAVAFLVLLNGFFVAAEFALVKIRDTQLETLVLKGHRRARIARRIVRNLDAALSSTQLGITLASLGLGWIGEPVFADLLHPVMESLQIQSEEVRHSISFAVGFSVITFLHIVLGELAPKSLAIQKPLPTSLWVAMPLEWFYKLAFPFIWALNHTANWVLRRFGIEPASEADLVHSSEELRLLFAASQKHSGGTQLGGEIVRNAFDLQRRVARDVMRPRQEIACFNTEDSLAECLDLAEKTRYSRFPLAAGGNLDKTLGIVHIKDLYALRLKAKCAADLQSAIRKLIYIPETARLEKVLQLLLERKLHMALVVDEYGGTVGLVTLENILEAIVGPIQDEFDQEKPLLVKTGENLWEVDGLLPLHELASLTGQELTSEGLTTTGGWITQKLGGFPKEGDALPLGFYELRVEEMDGLRVAKLKLTKRVEQSEESHS